VGRRRERKSERERRKKGNSAENTTEETRSWDLHVFIAQDLQLWIMQILSLLKYFIDSDILLWSHI
jgi:hypothetical protein